MTPEAWAVNLSAILAAVIAAGGTVWNARKTGRVEGKVDDATAAAEDAARKIEPVSNGFAKRTTTTLDEIKHIVQDVRAEQAKLSERVDRVEDRLVTHLELHARGGGGPDRP